MCHPVYVSEVCDRSLVTVSSVNTDEVVEGGYTSEETVLIPDSALLFPENL